MPAIPACGKSPPAGSSCGRSHRNQIESVISGGVYVGNDTSHERQSDFFLGPHKNHGFPGGARETVVFVGEEEQRRERVSGFTRIQAIRSL